VSSLDVEAHAVRLVPDSAYRVGAGNGAGVKAILVNAWHYPVEALCGCGGVIRKEEIGCGWYHTGRDAGQAPAGGTGPVVPPAGREG